MVDAMVRPLGTRFSDAFNPEEVELNQWGSLVMEFSSEDSGTIEFGSLHEKWGSEGYPIERLNRGLPAECDD